MIDVNGIFNGLLQAFKLAPNVTLNQFCNGVQNQGIATYAEAEVYANKFVEKAIGLTMLDDGDDFAALMQRVAAVPLDRAVNAARKVHVEVLQWVDYKIESLQLELAEAQEALAMLEAKIANIDTAVPWISANAPGSAELKADVLEAIDRGRNSHVAGVFQTNRQIAALQEQIDLLTGE